MDPETFKAVVLNAAIQGKLVQQDSDDEPASVLVEKIREERQKLIKEGKLKKDKNESFIFKRDNHYYENNGGTEIQVDNEFEYEVPPTWGLLRLKHLGPFGGGKTPSTSISDYWGGSINWISSKEVKTKYIANTERKLTELGAESMTMYPSNSLIFVMRSGILRRTFPIAILKRESTVNQDIKVLCQTKLVDSEYIYYAILAREKYILKKCSKDGTTVESIDDEKLKNLIIPIPPLSEQRRICIQINNLLSLAVCHQELLDSVATIAHNISQSLLFAAIQGKLVPQDPQDLPVQIPCKNPIIRRDNSYYEGDETIEVPFLIPKTWKYAKFKDIVSFKLGKTPARAMIEKYWKNGTIPWVSISDFVDGSIVTTTKERITQSAFDDCFTDYCPKGTLLMSFKLSIGRITVTGMDCVHNEAIISIKPKDNVSNDWLMIILPFISNWVKPASAVKGSTLNKKSMSEMVIPVPPFQEQKRIVSKMKQLTALVNNLV